MVDRSLLRVLPRRPLPALVAAAACAAGIALVAPPTAAASAARAATPAHVAVGTVTVVASGLDNPRGLVFVHGHLYVAEAGHGGTLCMPGGPEGGEQCAGLTSGISKIEHGRSHRVVDGLISLADKDGTSAEGVVALATHDGRLFAQVGANSRALPATLPSSPVVDAARRELGRTLAIGHRGAWWPIASTGNADYDWTAAHKSLQPDQFPDANPNGLTVRGGSIYVADAGANLVARVRRNGHVSTVAYFQVPAGSPTDGVPTCVANAPDGSLYVGELLGGTFAPGGARVWQIWPNGRARVKWTGFTAIQGCGFDNRGNFYVTEFQTHGLGATDPHGAVVQIRPNGHRTTFGANALFVPSGFAYRDGRVYVSNWSIQPATNPGGPTGQVVSIKVG
jgi:sugar lactone lactonase YvrE